MLQTHDEQLPFHGYGYAIAFVLAYLVFLRASPTELHRLAHELPWAEVEPTVRANLNFGLDERGAVEQVIGHIEQLTAMVSA